MNVAELFSTFGIDTDFESFARVHSALAQVEQHAKSTADAARLARALEHVGGDSAKALDLIGLGGVAEAMEAAKKETTGWGKAIIVANQALEIGAKIYGGLSRGIGAVRGMVDASTEQASAALDMSQQLGLGVEAVQELGYAAGSSGSNIGELAAGLGKLANVADAAKKGGKDAAASLRAVGVSVADVRSGKQSLDGTLGQIADHFAKMPDGARKSALAVDLFGNSGRKLIPLLNKGSSGIDALRDEAINLGVVIDGDAARAMQGFGDETGKLHAQVDGLRNQAVAAIIPAITEMVQGLQGWIAANRQMLVGALTSALKAFLAVLRVVGFVLAGVIELIVFFSEHSNVLIALLGGLAAAFLYMGQAAIVAWLAAAWPIALVAAAVAALILLFPYIVKAAKAAGRGIAAAVDWIGDKFKALGRGVMSVFRGIGSFFAGVGSAIKAAWSAVFNWIDARIDSVKRAATGVANWLRDNIPGASAVLGEGSRRSLGASVAPTTGRPLGGATTNVQVGGIVVHASGDPQAIARAVGDHFDARVREAGDTLP